MQRWEEELAKHPINSVVKQFEEQSIRDVQIDDPALVIERNRFSKIARLLGRVIADLDAELAPIDLLNQLHSQLNSHGVIGSINEFAKSSNPEMFRQANNQIGSSLSYIYQLSSLKFSRSTKRADINASAKSFEQFVQQTTKVYEEYRVKVTQAEALVHNVVNDINAIKARADKLEETFNSNLAEWSTQATNNQNLQSTAFSDSQNARQSEYSKTLDGIRNEAKAKLDAFYKDQETTALDKQKALQANLDNIAEDAVQKHKRILDLYGLVAHDSVTGGYKTTADTEGRAANTWRRVTIGCIVVTAIWLIIVWLVKPDLTPEHLFWSHLIKSAGLAALFISAAVYASKQSTLHRLNERRARTFFLQVQAFDPFISDLPEDKKIALKEGMSGKIFGQDEFPMDSKLINASNYESVDKFIDVALKLKGIFIK
jgi:hypothetical protein